MRTFFLSLAGAFVALIIFFVAAFFILAGMIAAASAPEPQPSKIVLTVDLREDVTDQAPRGGFAALSSRPGFVDIVTKLKAAERDEAVKGVFVRGGEIGVSTARAEELRDVFLDLRAAGKFVIAHSQDVWSTSPSALRALSAADEVWVQPGVDFMTTGVSLETLFLKDLFDNLSVSPEIEALYEYKNAPNIYKETDYTDAHREATTALAQSIWDISIVDISEDRELSPNQTAAVIAAGPHTAQDMVDAGLMDKLGWPEEALEAALERGEAAEALAVAKYNPPTLRSGAPVIAVVGGEGAVVTGAGAQGFFDEEGMLASDKIAAALLEAGRDDRVKAVVFRVESPGGSPTASDQIWRAVERVQDMDKPVVVSMGRVAASGGYYISAGADHIVANRTTITGSIGIFGGKFAIADGLERLGINASAITVGGEFAGAYGTERFTDSQRLAISEQLQRGYDRFTGIVAEGRGMSQSDVHDVARGRVWTGEQALERGLVDSLGGFVDAIEVAKQLAEIDDEQQVRLINFPKAKSGIEAFEELFGASADTARAASIVNRLADDDRLSAVLTQIQALDNSRTQAQAPILIER
ncbi:MAG: signal peptide peptidase SppA [Pseudomonadota bacterium]